MEAGIGYWIGFNILAIILIFVDLVLFSPRGTTMSMRRAASMTLFWVSLALCFNAWVWHHWGSNAGEEFFTGYLLEKTLSVDNLFVFLLIFSYFKIPTAYQHRVLSLGILGALVLRGIFIGVGGILLHRFHWMTYVFGGLLLLTGLRMLFHADTEFDPAQNFIIRLFRRIVPTTTADHGHHFVVKEGGKWKATTLMMALVLVETTDVIFALDSIPAIYGVTDDPFIVYSSNVFAILGLRALYFVLAGMADRFRFLKTGISIVLILVGAKMMLARFYHVSPGVSLAIITSIIVISLLASWLIPVREGRRPA